MVIYYLIIPKIAIATPIFLAFGFVFTIYYVHIINFYLKTAREVKRIQDNSAAPFLGLF
jgi:hypothetical protein